ASSKCTHSFVLKSRTNAAPISSSWFSSSQTYKSPKSSNFNTLSFSKMISVAYWSSSIAIPHTSQTSLSESISSGSYPESAASFVAAFSVSSTVLIPPYAANNNINTAKIINKKLNFFICSYLHIANRYTYEHSNQTT